MTPTELDIAHGAMQAAPEDGAARLGFYQCLADCELFLLLAQEAGEDSMEPQVFPLAEGRYVLVFDREERLAEFTGEPAPYAALSGRALVGMLHGQGIGLGLNPDVAPSSILLPDTAVDWLAGILGDAPEAAQAAALREINAPDLPERLVRALDGRLARMGGLARAACLAAVRYGDGRSGHLLAVLGAAPGAEPALAKAVSEALVFSGLDEGTLDVAFFDPDSALAERLSRAGLRFDLPVPEPEAAGETVQIPGSAPGMDPSRPPKLK